MPKRQGRTLNNIGYVEAVKAFARVGFVVKRQSGSHITMSKPGHRYNVVIPAHKPLALGTLRTCIDAAGLSESQFITLL